MDDIIKVDILHNLHKNKIWKEIKLNKYDKIKNIKKKIYSHTGTLIEDMKLYAYHECNKEMSQVFLGNDELCLDDYNVGDTFTIYVYETNERLSKDIYNMDDEETLEKLKDLKYKISEEDYNKRQDSMRVFKKKMKALQKQNMQNNINNENENIQRSLNENDLNNLNESGYIIGNRCKVTLGDRRGVLKYIGHLNNTNEIFVGVDLDEPLGNSNGFYKKKFLFECKGDKYGYLGDINSIEMGNFPSIDIMNIE